MFEVGKEYQTKNGSRVRLIARDADPNTGEVVLVGWDCPDGQCVVLTWSEEGSLRSGSCHGLDLAPPPEWPKWDS